MSDPIPEPIPAVKRLLMMETEIAKLPEGTKTRIDNIAKLLRVIITESDGKYNYAGLVALSLVSAEAMAHTETVNILKMG